MQNDNGERPLTKKQQELIDLLYFGKLPIPRFNNLPPGFDMENIVEATKLRVFQAIVNRDLDIKCLVAYWRTCVHRMVCDELKKNYPVWFISLDDNSIPPQKLEKFMADPTALEKIHEQVNLALLFKNFVDNIKELSDLQKNLVKYWMSGLSQKEIARRSHLSLSQLDVEMKLAKYIFMRETRKRLMRKDRDSKDREG